MNLILRIRRFAKLAADYVELDLLVRKVERSGRDARGVRDIIGGKMIRDMRRCFDPEAYRLALYRDVARLAYQRVRYGRCYLGTSGFCCDTGNFSDVRAERSFRHALASYLAWNDGERYMSDGPSSAWVAAPSDDGYRYSQAPYGWGVN